MNRFIVICVCVLAAACGNGGGRITQPPPPEPALDPFLTVRIRHQLDTTSANGRAEWQIYLLLTSPESPSQEGVTRIGSISLSDVRGHRDVLCGRVASDSIGNRFISLLAVADTTTEALTPDATANAIVAAWFAGDHSLPDGWKALVVPPVDAWNSAQWAAGHGLTREDPIKWSWDWTNQGESAFYERSDADISCDRV